MNDMKKEEKSLSVSTLQYDMGGDTLQSRKRHGWAPAKDDYQDEISNPRPVSYPGSSINQIYNVDLYINETYSLCCHSLNTFNLTLNYSAFPSGSSTAESSVLDDAGGKNLDISNSWAAELNLHPEDSDARYSN